MTDWNDLPVYGIDKELRAKQDAKYDPKAEGEARQWVEAVTGERIHGSFHEGMRDGILLCKVINAIRPGSIRNVNAMKQPFFQRENISKYLEACKGLGLPPHDIFNPDDLYDGKNMILVIQNIFSLARQAQSMGFRGPSLGPKLSEANRRQFTDEQLRQAAAAPTFISQGSHGKATQAGQFDTSRNIVKTQAPATDVPTRQTMGSYGGATQSGQFDHSRDIVKTQTGGASGSVPSRQTMGSYGGATQSGQFDRSREIIKGPK